MRSQMATLDYTEDALPLPLVRAAEITMRWEETPSPGPRSAIGAFFLSVVMVLAASALATAGVVRVLIMASERGLFEMR